MENQTAFDLNLAIRHWREGLAQSAAFRNENLDELESHLRDSIERLQSTGLSGEEAFLIATRRVGNVQRLEEEYGKLNHNNIWLGRAMWMLIGLQVWPLLDGLLSVLGRALFAVGWRNVPHSPSAVGDAWPVFFATLIQLPALVVAVWLTWKVLRNSGKIGQRIVKKLPGNFSFAVCCIGVCLISFLLYAVLFLLSIGWIRLSESSFHDRTASYVVYSQQFVGVLRVIGFAILTLLLARKQFVPKKA